MANGEKARHLLAIHHIKAEKRNMESVKQDAPRSGDLYAPDTHSAQGTATVTHQINSSTLSDETWFCNVCNIQMPESCKSTHLKSQMHYEEATFKPWTCDVCKLTMAKEDKARHLLATRHDMNLVPPSGAQWGLCNVCSILMDAKDVVDHVSGRRHQAKVELKLWLCYFGWECAVCRISIAGRDREMHLSGKKHRLRAKSNKYQKDQDQNGSTSISCVPLYY
ncbi:hypothetical protein BDQ17DRAFT_966849 [Cyathus striatus]|nr:hypothetical protein BDQ17DRAFT_966849 [Cyathus striatus]